MSAQLEGNNASENNDNSVKDVRLLLLPETSSVGNPTGVISRSQLQKIFIDDLRRTDDVGNVRRKRVWRVPSFILLMCFMQISLYFIANECMQKRLIFKPKWSGECWRLLTYMMLHSDYWHLTLNICLQCFIGICLEVEQGHWRLAVVYIVGGVAGSLANAWLQPHLLLMGASAGVYAMLGSHVPHLVRNFSQLSQRYARIAALLILFLSDVGFTMYHFHHNHNRNPRISLEAHIGGGVAGILCGLIAYRRIRQPTQTAIYC
ncbi:protein rhomboid [Drosophila rhopaloa]|uniref:Protein rhomboid n=1 Tax=Drosophila rhopaloa TaxID=1041015 RepID=A0A6P4F2H6_DRORH|nr:protein rhomboid [Drosophila rhopaloa]